ncbi:MAG: acyltransferase family protein, partial [Pseudomonadota bacterium]
MAKTLDYRADIDGLRAIAVLAVVIFHLGFKPLEGGFLGVDVFFVISGFLITAILERRVENKALS